MTATDELRRLLDELGVEYYASPNGVAWGKLATPIHGRMYTHYAVELDGLLCVDSHCITPAQAIEATLGRGTCKAVYKPTGIVCSECGGGGEGGGRMSKDYELQKRMAEQMEFVLSQTPEALAAENAKLRELLKEHGIEV